MESVKHARRAKRENENSAGKWELKNKLRNEVEREKKKRVARYTPCLPAKKVMEGIVKKKKKKKKKTTIKRKK